jgi:molybdopterin-guanine dinucleotide biosynthesis protein A
MPFLNPALLAHMLHIAPGFDVVMPRFGGEMEPLHAIYSRACLPHIRKQLERRELRIILLLDRVTVRYVCEDEITAFDDEGLSFFNVNTPADLQRMRDIARRRRRALDEG